MQRIDWDSITITNDHMFGSVFGKNEDLCAELLEIVLRVPIDHIEYVRRDTGLLPEPGSKGIRLDVYAADGKGTVYDVEMQNVNEGNLERRSRYYQSTMALDCVGPGMSYSEMADSFVVFICSFDPFQRGLPKYTVTPHCKEDGVEMADGSTRVFVNSTAAQQCDDARLRAFLAYLQGDTMVDDPFTMRVNEMVDRLKRNPEWRLEHMRFEDYVAERCAIAAREAREEALAEGRKEGQAEGEQRRQALISSLHKALASSGRIEELGAALDDEPLFESLLSEFGICDDTDPKGKA